LTKVSANLSPGSTVLFPPAVPGGAGPNVGGEWAYKASLVGAPGGASQGISSAGFGLFGPPDRFVTSGPFSNLQGAPSPGAVEYGITSAVDVPTPGSQAAINGSNALIKNSVTFFFTPSVALPGTLTAANFSHVSFQYGTALNNANDPNVPCNSRNCVDVPEPSTLLLLGSALAGVGAWRQKHV